MKCIRIIFIIALLAAYSVSHLYAADSVFSLPITQFQQDTKEIATSAFKETPFAVAAHFGMLVPLGEFGNSYIGGVSFTGQFNVYPNKNYFGYIKSGYIQFDQDSRYFNYNFQYSSYPLLFGAAYMFDRPGIVPYVGIEAGMHFTRYKEGAGNNLVYVERKTEFGGGGIFGMKLVVSGNVAGEANASYNFINTDVDTRSYFAILFGLIVKI